MDELSRDARAENTSFICLQGAAQGVWKDTAIRTSGGTEDRIEVKAWGFVGVWTFEVDIV